MVNLISLRIDNAGAKDTPTYGSRSDLGPIEVGQSPCSVAQTMPMLIVHKVLMELVQTQ